MNLVQQNWQTFFAIRRQDECIQSVLHDSFLIRRSLLIATFESHHIFVFLCFTFPAEAIYDMFHTRSQQHRKLYQHHKVKVRSAWSLVNPRCSKDDHSIVTMIIIHLTLKNGWSARQRLSQLHHSSNLVTMSCYGPQTGQGLYITHTLHLHSWITPKLTHERCAFFWPLTNVVYV